MGGTKSQSVAMMPTIAATIEGPSPQINGRECQRGIKKTVEDAVAKERIEGTASQKRQDNQHQGDRIVFLYTFVRPIPSGVFCIFPGTEDRADRSSRKSSITTNSYLDSADAFIEGAAKPSRSRELAEEADVILVKQREFTDAVLHHGEAVNAHAEGKAGKFLRVLAHEAVDGRVHHAGAEKLNPTGKFADAAARAAANVAGGVHFRGRLGEREIA